MINGAKTDDEVFSEIMWDVNHSSIENLKEDLLKGANEGSFKYLYLQDYISDQPPLEELNALIAKLESAKDQYGEKLPQREVRIRTKELRKIKRDLYGRV